MNKDKVLELAQKADVWVAGQTPYQEQLERFATLIEREVRGDAKPVAWIDSRQLDTISDFDATVYANGGFDFAQPLYTHPAPAVVRQLFVSADRLRSCARYINNEQLVVGEEELMELKAALAAARENGL